MCLQHHILCPSGAKLPFDPCIIVSISLQNDGGFMKKLNPKTRKKILKIAIPVVIVVVLLVLLLRGASSAANSMYVAEKVQRRDIVTYHTFTGNIEAVNDVSLMPKTMAEVTEVFFNEGDEVHKGDILAQLDDSSLRNTIALKESALSTTEKSNFYQIRDAKKAYDDYAAGIANGDNAQLISAKATLDNAKSAYESARDTYERAKLELENNIDASMIQADSSVKNAKQALDLAKKHYDDNEGDIRGAEQHGFPTDNLEALRDTLQEAIDQAQLAYDNAVNAYLSTYNSSNTKLSNYYDQMNSAYNSYVTAQESYDATVVAVNQTLESYANASEKATELSSTETSVIELKNLYDQLDDYQIVASIDGILTDFDIEVGDTLSTAKAAAEITDYSTVQVAIKIDEYDILGVEDGMQVDINIDALDRNYSGTLKNVSKKATVEKGVSYFTADVEFEADEYVRTGMSVEVKIKNHDVSDVVSVSMNALYYENDNTAYVLVSKGKSYEKKYITVGVTDGSYVEVTDGLSEGDTVQAMTSMMKMMMSMQGSGTN